MSFESPEVDALASEIERETTRVRNLRALVPDPARLDLLLGVLATFTAQVRAGLVTCTPEQLQLVRLHLEQMRAAIDLLTQVVAPRRPLN